MMTEGTKKKTKAKRLLVADDTEFYRLMLKAFLEKAGYEIDTASSTQETLEKTDRSSSPYDLLILDLLMDKKSGLDILQALGKNKEKRGIPVVAMSKYYQETFDIEKLKHLGVRGYFDKSHPLEEILFCVNQILFPGLKDLRKSPRAQVSNPVNVQYQEQSLSSQTFNLSKDGMFIITTTSPPPPPNTKIRLRFWLPGSKDVIECEAVAIWCNNHSSSMNELYPPGMGVMFMQLSDEQTQCINHYVREKLSSILRW